MESGLPVPSRWGLVETELVQASADQMNHAGTRQQTIPELPFSNGDHRGFQLPCRPLRSLRKKICSGLFG